MAGPGPEVCSVSLVKLKLLRLELSDCSGNNKGSGMTACSDQVQSEKAMLMQPYKHDVREFHLVKVLALPLCTVCTWYIFLGVVFKFFVWSLRHGACHTILLLCSSLVRCVCPGLVWGLGQDSLGLVRGIIRLEVGGETEERRGERGERPVSLEKDARMHLSSASALAFS